MSRANDSKIIPQNGAQRSATGRRFGALRPRARAPFPPMRPTRVGRSRVQKARGGCTSAPEGPWACTIPEMSPSPIVYASSNVVGYTTMSRTVGHSRSGRPCSSMAADAAMRTLTSSSTGAVQPCRHHWRGRRSSARRGTAGCRTRTNAAVARRDARSAGVEYRRGLDASRTHARPRGPR